MQLDAQVRALGHLAVWLGLYFAGSVTLFAHAAGLPVTFSSRWILAWLAAAATGTGVYLFDRVKIRTEWSETTQVGPGAREAFVEGRTASVRALAVGLLLIATALAWMLAPRLALVTLGAFGAVTLYAGLPVTRRGRGRRLKDVPGVKYAIACGGIGVLAASFAHAASEVDPTLGETLPGLAVVLGVVFADLVLCDLDDLEPDARAGSRTLPVLLGPRAGMAVAWLALAAALMPTWPAGLDSAPIARGLWKAGLVATTAAICLGRRRGTRRDWIDARLGLLAVLAVAVG